MGEAKIVIPERGYFSLPRNAAQDGRLALATRGLLALMLSLPSDWDYTVTGHQGRLRPRKNAAHDPRAGGRRLSRP